MADVTVKFSGSLSRGNTSIYKTLITNAALEIAEEVKKAAIEDYKRKRKSTDSKSFIIDSFNFSIKNVGGTDVHAIVFAGGPTAPYAIYVDQGHRYRGGSGSFSGYFFMKAGADHGRAVAGDIVSKWLNKATR